MNRLLICCVVFGLFLAACSQSTTRPLLTEEVEVKKISSIKYGMTENEISGSLGVATKPLFKFEEKGKIYTVHLIRPKNTKEGYCLLYEENKLISLFTVDTGRRAWVKVFGYEDDRSFPSPEKFSQIIEVLTSLRLDIKQTDFSKPGHYKYSRSDRFDDEYSGSVYHQFGTYLAFAFPPLAGTFIGAGVAASVADLGMHEYSVDAGVEQSKLDYPQFRKMVDSLAIGSTKETIVEKLGISYSSAFTEKGEALVYQHYFLVVIGLVRGKLKWIAYDYDPELIYRLY